MPADLAKYLAYLSIASPAVIMARTWSRLFENEDYLTIACEASKMARAILDMFNKQEATDIIKKRYKGEKYFKSILRYVADGDLQAVVDEYGHLLKGSGLSLQSASKKMCEVLTINTVHIDCHFREDMTKATKDDEIHKLRCHYAVPLGNQKLSDEKGIQRIEHVRDAFNSPFRPFVLNSTSIGQEGLDFHWYCHRVVHWNLPANPIDIEQREGRVNRYKSLMVRKRVAEQHKTNIANSDDDLWNLLFRYADEYTEASRKSDLTPYWHYPKGNIQIERFVPMNPMSKEVNKLENALKILALYRLAFGQPRQEELMEHLLKRNFTGDELSTIKAALMINLCPLL